jgi:hypothetical protein
MYNGILDTGTQRVVECAVADCTSDTWGHRRRSVVDLLRRESPAVKEKNSSRAAYFLCGPRIPELCGQGTAPQSSTKDKLAGFSWMGGAAPPGLFIVGFNGGSSAALQPHAEEIGRWTLYSMPPRP